MKRNIRYRVSVVVVHEERLLGFHAEDPHNKKMYFFIPGGQVEQEELPQDTAVRETWEETGFRIEVLPRFEIRRSYDFEWDGKINECHTIFYAGRLLHSETSAVNDAPYHRGVFWLPLKDVAEALAYHKDISEPVQFLLKKCLKVI